MKTKWIIMVALGGFVVVALSNTYKVTSTGAPVGSTGAPGETTCARSGCHTGDRNLNTGPGVLDVQIEDLKGGYIPGNTYRVTVTLEQHHIRRFGFSVVALNTQAKSVGCVQVSEPTRMQVLRGSNQFAGRDYITYKASGTDPYAPGKGQWTFDWKAPVQREGPVTFYLAAVSANNDGTDLGDEVYTDSLVINGMDESVQKLIVEP